jgi:hypothetical protein
LFGTEPFPLLKFGHEGKQIRIAWEVLKCGGEGLKVSFGPIVVRKNKVLQRVKEKRNNINVIKQRKSIWIGHVLLRTAF